MKEALIRLSKATGFTIADLQEVAEYTSLKEHELKEALLIFKRKGGESINDFMVGMQKTNHLQD